MKRNLLILLFFMAISGVYAQQESQFTQFMYNKLLINPAYAGSRGVPSVTAVYRSQWVGFEGAPQSMLATFNSPFLTNRVGVGLTVANIKIGLNRDTYGALSYSYDLVAQENVSVRFGISASIRSLAIAYNEATVIDIGDNSVANQKENDIFGNVGAGLYATLYNRFYVGFSVPRLYSNVTGFTNNNAVLLAKEYQHFYGMAGAILPLSDDISLMPAILIKYVQNAPLDADINLNLDIKQKFTVGTSYRMGGDGAGDSVDMLAFWQATPRVGVGVAYDFTLSRLKDYNGGSFEVLLQADLKQDEKLSGKKKMTNPRFFM